MSGSSPPSSRAVIGSRRRACTGGLTNGKLAAQFPPPPVRLVYAASRTNSAATILQDPRGVIEHKLYWGGFDKIQEARYLEAILNSEAIREITEPLQSKGQKGARDFDKYILRAIPALEPSLQLHRELTAAAELAKEAAAGVELPENVYFVRARQLIRDALAEDGVADKTEGLVRRLI